MYDAIIVGGGPSGVMAAITAAEKRKKVLLLDKNDAIGKKMRISGGGRCNITNRKDVETFIKSLPIRNGRFLYHALYQFGPEEIYRYFTERGVPLKVEDNDRVFPVSDRSMDFIGALSVELNQKKVDLKFQTEVLDIKIDEEGIKEVHTNRGNFKAKNVVIATGGQSYPHTGSSGFGHHWSENYGIDVQPLFPTESPILSNDPLIQSKVLQGLSFKDVLLRLKDERSKTIKEHRKDFIITHFGLSGPGALMLSQFVYHYLKDHREALITIDFLPDRKEEELFNEIKAFKQSNPLKHVYNALGTYGQTRLIEYVLEKLNLSRDLQMANLDLSSIRSFIDHLKNFPIKVHDVKPLPYAFVTGGGISIKEIDPKTMESKKIDGLYYTGEVLDLHGYTGGYNITIALSTGYTAGLAIGEKEN